MTDSQESVAKVMGLKMMQGFDNTLILGGRSVQPVSGLSAAPSRLGTKSTGDMRRHVRNTGEKETFGNA